MKLGNLRLPFYINQGHGANGVNSPCFCFWEFFFALDEMLEWRCAGRGISRPRKRSAGVLLAQFGLQDTALVLQGRRCC